MRVPSTRSFSRLIRRSSVVLPLPAGPKKTVTALRRDVQRHIVQRLFGAVEVADLLDADLGREAACGQACLASPLPPAAEVAADDRRHQVQREHQDSSTSAVPYWICGGMPGTWVLMT